MGGGPSSKSESKSELPPWYVPYAKQSLELSNRIAQQGYTPYSGPDVAAFNPQQMQGMQMANDWASTMSGKKMPKVVNTIPKPQKFAGGISGYSSAAGYNQALDRLQKQSPGLFDYIRSFAINPITGKPATQYNAVSNFLKHNEPGAVLPNKPVASQGPGGPWASISDGRGGHR